MALEFMNHLRFVILEWQNICYGIFIRCNMVKNASNYYPVLQSYPHLKKMLESDDMKTPSRLECTFENNKYVIKKRIFMKRLLLLSLLVN